MSAVKDLIDSNDAANAYYRYMRKARRDGDKMPTRVHTEPQARMLVKELNNELDKLQFGYRSEQQEEINDFCVRCGAELGEKKRIVRSVYLAHRDYAPYVRIDYFVCGECHA